MYKQDRELQPIAKWLQKLGFKGKWGKDCQGGEYYWVESRNLIIGVFSSKYFRKAIAGKLVAESARTFHKNKLEQIYYRTSIPVTDIVMKEIEADLKEVANPLHTQRASKDEIWEKEWRVGECNSYSVESEHSPRHSAPLSNVPPRRKPA